MEGVAGEEVEVGEGEEHDAVDGQEGRQVLAPHLPAARRALR